eukprot:gene16042-biopygen14304
MMWCELFVLPPKGQSDSVFDSDPRWQSVRPEDRNPSGMTCSADGPLHVGKRQPATGRGPAPQLEFTGQPWSLEAAAPPPNSRR